MTSILLRGGKIIDGTGKASWLGDLLIVGSKIHQMDKQISSSLADKVMDVEGLCVAPGFIDVHSHSDLSLLSNPLSEEKIFQGVTTEIIGNCGLTIFPHNIKTKSIISEYVSPVLGIVNDNYPCARIREYLSTLEKIAPSVNVGALVGHGSIRAMAIGFENRAASSDEIVQMKGIVENAMQDGAFGMSSGLVYAPGSFSNNDEVTAINSVVSKYGGIYTTHLRDQGIRLTESIEDTIAVSLDTNVDIHISHLKAIGRDLHNERILKALELMEQAERQGVNVTSDAYPYTAGCSMLSRVFPNWVLEGGNQALIERLQKKQTVSLLEANFRDGIAEWENIVGLIGWENVVIASVASQKNKFTEGLNIEEIARKLEITPVQAVCKLVVEEQGQVTHISYIISEENLIKVLKNKTTMFGTDGINIGSRPHPRLYHTFPRILGRYVRETTVLCIEEAIRKMTALPAKTFGLEQMGCLKKGAYADITVFDDTTIKDTGTFQNPASRPDGIELVFVNGEIVLKNGIHTGKQTGRILRKRNVPSRAN